MKLPIKSKYVDEAQSPLMIFGTHLDGTVDVSDAQRDVFSGLPYAVAKAVVEANERYMAELYQILCNEPKETPK